MLAGNGAGRPEAGKAVQAARQHEHEDDHPQFAAPTDRLLPRRRRHEGAVMKPWLPCGLWS